MSSRVALLAAGTSILMVGWGCSGKTAISTKHTGGTLGQTTGGATAPTSGSGGMVGLGGATGTGGLTGSGGVPSTGGSIDGGGWLGSGGAPGAGGVAGTGSGGHFATGGQTGSGGVTGVDVDGGTNTDGVDAAGGGADTGGTVVTGGTLGPGGIGGTGGTLGAGGTFGTGGTPGTGGTAGAGGATRRAGPCDIYQDDFTPCVAAHSTVRALFTAYQGPLYQVRKGDSVKDILAGADGIVDVSAQDAFCAGAACTISIVYDQSGYRNHLTKSPPAEWLPDGGNEANATAAKVTVGGHTAYGILIDNPKGNIAYRINITRGLATGDQSESMYMVVDGGRYSQWCCFDYGNATTSGKDDGVGTTEAVYFGAAASYSAGGGQGPWVAADLGLGVWEGDKALSTSNTPVSFPYVTAMLKGPAGNRFVLKAGNAQSSPLETKWDGPRPSGYSPMNKEGAIVLGTSSDGSNTGVGIFFEGCITSGSPTDATDDAVQANIVAAGYGR